jgi:hypothetical protein
MLTTCKLKVVVYHPGNKNRVTVIPTTGTVYRRPSTPSRQKEKVLNYWEPHGDYYVKYGPFVLGVSPLPDWTGFELQLDIRNFLRVFFPQMTMEQLRGQTSKASTAGG